MIKVYGPYERSDGRKHVIVYDSKTQERKTVSYPKFLMEKKLGRKLKRYETVDHIDEDFTNDRISNLQVLSRRRNNSKSLNVRYGKKLKCDFCHIKLNRRFKWGTRVFCSNSHRNKFYGANQYGDKLKGYKAGVAQRPRQRT